MITTLVDKSILNQIQWGDLACNPLRSTPFNKKINVNDSLTISIQDKNYTINHNFLINCEKNPEPLLIYYCEDFLFLCKAAQYGITGVFDMCKNVLIIPDLVYEIHFKSVVENFLRLREKYNSEFSNLINNTTFAKKQICTFIGTRQIMHHFMQELPGVQKLFNTINIQKIYSFFEYYGPHNYVLNTKIPIENVLSVDQLFLDTCIKHNFYYKVVPSHTTPELITRIKTYAYELCELPLLTYNKCFLFTIRTTKRILKNQEEFIVNCIKQLENLYPGSLFFIDGYTKLYNSWVTETHPHVIKEQKIFKNIQKQLPDIKLQSLIFVDILTYINYVQKVDFYIAHIGTLQHKIGFFSKARGLVHGGADKLQGDWTKLWYNESHFGKTVQRFSDECVEYENDTYNSSYNMKIDQSVLFLQQYITSLVL